MKSVLVALKSLGILSVGVFSIGFLVSLAIYRVPHGLEMDQVEGAVHYQLSVPDSSYRHFFEELLGNKAVKIDGYPAFFVSTADHAKLWPENPYEMSRKGYTIKATLKMRHLVFGGVSKAEVVSAEVINEKPIIVN